MQSRIVLLPRLWPCWLCVLLLSPWFYLLGVRLPPQVVCVRRKSNSRWNLGTYLCRALRLCCPVCGPGCEVPGCAPAGTIFVLALRVLAEHVVVPARRAIASDYTCSRRVLAEPKIVCVRRKSNPRCNLGMNFAVCYGCEALCVGLSVQSRVALLLGLWSCWLCVYMLSLRSYLFGVRLPQVVCALDVCCPSTGLCAFDVNRTRDSIPVNTLFCGTAVLLCTWANLCSPGLCSCRDYVRSTYAVRA